MPFWPNFKKRFNGLFFTRAILTSSKNNNLPKTHPPAAQKWAAFLLTFFRFILPLNMNSHQRRKFRRKLGVNAPVLIKDWAELAQVPESSTHRLEIDVEGCNGWIIEKKPRFERKLPIYLSTHTFYGGNHKQSTRTLRQCGFNVTIDNWDKTTNIS